MFVVFYGKVEERGAKYVPGGFYTASLRDLANKEGPIKHDLGAEIVTTETVRIRSVSAGIGRLDENNSPRRVLPVPARLSSDSLGLSPGL